MTDDVHRKTKLLLIVIMIIVIIVVIVYLLQLIRYFRLRSRDYLYQLDKKYRRDRKECHNYGYRVVITLSTIPERLDLLGPTLASLLDQSVHVNEIGINIPWVSRKGKKYYIPDWLEDLHHVKVHRVDVDEGPATKLLPTLRREKPDTRIIVVDDDNIYHRETIKVLLKTHNWYLQQKEHVAVTNYGVSLDCDGDLPDIPERIYAAFYRERQVDLLQGFSGFLVTPAMFPKEALSMKHGPTECISVDDIWFSGWLTVNGIPIVAPGNTYAHLPLLTLGDIRCTPALASGENKNFVTDKRVIQWFRDKHHIW
jgi:hypothetical protein